MTENTSTTYRSRISAFLFGNRIIITNGTRAVANLPILVGIVAVLCSIRLTVFAVIIALVLGYRFSIEKYASESFDAAVRDAAEKVKKTVKDAAEKIKNSAANMSAQVKDSVENVKQEIKTGIDTWDGAEDHH